MRLCHGAKHSFNSRCDAWLIRSAFEDGCLNASAGNALFDVINKHVDHHLGPAECGSRPLKVKVHRHVVVGIDPGSNKDIDIGLCCDSLDSRDVAAQSDYGQINYGINASRFELTESCDCVAESLVFF